MGAFFSIDGLIAAGFWAAVIYRFGITFRYGIQRSGPAQRQAWLSWLTFFCIALAATVYHPAMQSFLAAGIGEWFSTVPRVSIAIAAYLLQVYICYDFAPQVRPRWDWPFYGGLLTVGLYILIMQATASGILPTLSPMSVLADLFFNVYMELLVVLIVFPSLAAALRQERQRPMRLRFYVMWSMHAMIAVWMLTGIVESLLIITGWRVNFAAFYILLMSAGFLAFTASYLMPASYFVQAVRALDYLTDLWTFGLVRILEINAAQWTGRDLLPIGAAEVLMTPASAVYKSIIAIFDARKLLQAQNAIPPRILATQLETVARPELEYPEIVGRLREIGFAELHFFLSHFWLLTK